METLPQTWPFPDSVIGGGRYDDQRAAAAGGDARRRIRKESPAAGRSRPPTQPIDVSTFDAPY